MGRRPRDMGHLPPPGDMRLGTSSPALPQPHMTPPPPPPDGDTDTTGCSAPQAAPVRAAGPAASSSSGPTACNRPSSSGPLEQFLVNHFAKPLARLLNLKHHQDLRTLAIVSVFYYLQWFRWHHWDTAVAERVRGWGSGPAGVGLPMAVSESLILLLDLLWLAMGCLWAFFCATIVHNCIHVAQFHNYHLNTAWNIVLTHSYGHPVSTLIPGHNLSHHKYVQTPKDVMRTTRMRWKYNLLNMLFFVPTMIRTITQQDGEYFR